MPQPGQHTANAPASQAQVGAQDCWDELVQSRLPAELEEQARALGAFVRVRALPNAQALLRAVLAYVLSLPSLKHLSGWSRLLGVSKQLISPQAWHKRLQRCGPWLLWLCNTLLDLRLSTRGLPTHQRILLVDATHLSQVGRRGATWRLHSAYDLLSGRLAWLQVSDHRQGESLALLPIQPGDILVADKAYNKAPQLLAVQQAQAFSLTAFSPWHLPVSAPSAPTESSEFRLDVKKWLAPLRAGTYERSAVVFCQGQRLAVRLIAVVPPAEQAEALRKLAQQKAREKGRVLSQQSLFLAGFHLLVTTLQASHWPTALVLDLYRCRWQIEILFKRIKQVLDLHRLCCHTPQTAQAIIAALVVAWLLIEEESEHLRRHITDAEPLGWPVSSWQLNQWAAESLQHVVVGWYSPKQLFALAPQLRRLFIDKRKRPLLEHLRRRRFHERLFGEPDPVFDCSSA